MRKKVKIRTKKTAEKPLHGISQAEQVLFPW